MKRTKAIVVVGLIAVILFSVAYYLALRSYQKESEDQATLLAMGDNRNPDRVDLIAQILSVDPLRGETRIRLTFSPRGDLSKDGSSSACGLRLLAPGAAHSDSSELLFEDGATPGPLDLSYVLEGQVNDYPFDVHSTQLIYALNRTDPDRRVPSTILVKGNVPGYFIHLEPLERLPQGVSAINMTVSRSATVQKAALAGVVVMWAVGLGVAALIALMLSGWYNVRMPAFFAALLFGLFSLRNSLPGTPPIGTYSDFLSFLWVQGIVSVALLVSIVGTMKRRPA